MTREQVIKGIETHISNSYSCTGCPYLDARPCFDKLMDDALALIKAQKEELIQLRRANLQLKEWASDFVKGEGHEAD